MYKDEIKQLLKKKVIWNRIYTDTDMEAELLEPMLIKRAEELKCDPSDLIDAVEQWVLNEYPNASFNQALEMITVVPKIERVLRRRKKL